MIPAFEYAHPNTNHKVTEPFFLTLPLPHLSLHCSLISHSSYKVTRSHVGHPMMKSNPVWHKFSKVMLYQENARVQMMLNEMIKYCICFIQIMIGNPGWISHVFFWQEALISWRGGAYFSFFSLHGHPKCAVDDRHQQPVCNLLRLQTYSQYTRTRTNWSLTSSESDSPGFPV